MRSCQEISRLYSESLDRKLAWRDRLGLWMHLQMCKMCRGFARHLQLFRDASRLFDERFNDDAADEVTMPGDVRERIRQELAKVEP